MSTISEKLLTLKEDIDAVYTKGAQAGLSVTNDATAAGGDILSGKTAYVKGSKVTGYIPTKTAADVIASGANVSVPFGYYSDPVNKSVAIAERATTTLGSAVSSNKMTFTATNAQATGYVTADASKNTATKTVSVSANGKTVTATDGTNSISASVADGSATTPATTITSAPTISVNSDGLITASNSKTQSITPTVSVGYVSSGTAGTVTVSGSNTRQLVTKAAETYTPSANKQTIQSGQYLTGTQTILGDSNLTAANIKSGAKIFNVTGTYTNDATATASDIKVGVTAYVKGQKITGTLASASIIPSLVNTKWQLYENLADHAGNLQELTLNLDYTINNVQYKQLQFESYADGADDNTYLHGIETASNNKVTLYDCTNSYHEWFESRVGDRIITIYGGTDIQNADAIAFMQKVAAQLEFTTGDATATASDILSGKTAYVNGEKITGTISTLSAVGPGIFGEGAVTSATLNLPGTGSKNAIRIAGTAFSSGYVKPNSTVIQAYSQLTNFGDAAASDVVAGKTFTSSAGLKATGTLASTSTLYQEYEDMYYDDDGNIVMYASIPRTLIEDEIEIYSHPGNFGNANAANVLAGKTFTSAAGLVATGTMPTLTTVGPGIVGNFGVVQQATTSTPAGNVDCVEISGVTMASGYVSGTNTVVKACASFANFGDAEAAHVLAGKTFTSTPGFKVTGTMPAHSGITTTLAAGESYQIPLGYHDATTFVEAKSLASQTQATATADMIRSGYTAYVNGEQITGTVTTAIGGLTLRGNPSTSYSMGPGVGVYANVTEPTYISPDTGSSIQIWVPYDSFGNATAEDVVAGKTFTSAAGLHVTGTATLGVTLERAEDHRF